MHASGNTKYASVLPCTLYAHRNKTITFLLIVNSKYASNQINVATFSQLSLLLPSFFTRLSWHLRRKPIALPAPERCDRALPAAERFAQKKAKQANEREFKYQVSTAAKTATFHCFYCQPMT